MRSLVRGIAALCAVPAIIATASAQSQSDISAKINSALPSNSRGQITAAAIRDVFNAFNNARGQPNGFATLGPDGKLDIGLILPKFNNGLSIDAPGEVSTIKGAYFTVDARGLYGSSVEWLGNSATGSPTNYGYGNFAAGVFLSPIGDVGISAATRTDMITSPGRFSAAGNFQAFNFNTNAPQTSYGAYIEARRKKGTGQIHGIEVDVTELGDYTDRIIPSAMKSGPNAVYGAYASGINIASGGNVTTRTLPDGTVVQQQYGWDGTKNVSQARDVGSALAIYRNGAAFEKGIIISEDAVVGCDGTGEPRTCTGIEMGRGTDIGWIDGSTRIGSLIRSDLSPSGNGLRLRFTDFGMIFDGYGGATLQVVGKSTDVNGIQVLGGGVASSPARIVASGSANASLGLSGSGGGVVQMQAVMQLVPYTVATLPACDAARIGGMAYVTDSAAVNYRNAANNGGGSLKAPVFCTGEAWEYH